MFYIASFYFLATAIKHTDVGIAYAIWAGTGTALIAIVGVAFFKEPFNALEAICTLLIIAGVIGLNIRANLHGAVPM